MDTEQIRAALAHGLGMARCGAGDRGVLPRGDRREQREGLVIAVDSLVEGVHFPPVTDARSVGYKALAVNLSDLAAMGAQPRCYTVALTLPQRLWRACAAGSPSATALSPWLDGFVQGLRELAAAFAVVPVAVDVTEGPLAVTVQAFGTSVDSCLLRRGAARPGDGIYVTGTLGDAALGLELRQGGDPLASGQAREVLRRLEYPVPRVHAGRAACGVANAAIDVSDGLAADLGHILAASGVGARVELECLPLSRALCALRSPAYGRRVALSGGDDYELCLTAPASAQAELAAALEAVDTPVTRIGTVEAQAGLRLVDARGAPVSLDAAGYRHFNG